MCFPRLRARRTGRQGDHELHSQAGPLEDREDDRKTAEGEARRVGDPLVLECAGARPAGIRTMDAFRNARGVIPVTARNWRVNALWSA